MRVSTDISVSDWASFNASHSRGTIFQSPEMFEFFKKVKRTEPFVLAAYDDEKLCGVLAGTYMCEKEGFGKLLSSRLVIYGGPLLSGDEVQKKACLDLLLGELVRQTRGKALFTQFRNYFSWKEYLDIFEKYGFSLLDRMNYVVDIEGERATEDGMWQALQKIKNNMSESRKRQISKGLASGAEIIEPENIDQVKEFYNILFKLYRYKIRKPLADWSFFENFYLASKEGRLGIIRLVKYNGMIIGGILSPLFEHKCIYEWYVCGLDKEYKEQYPSVLATWAAIEYAANNDMNCFDFMGVGKLDIPYGVRDFKARFGGKLVNYGRLTRINNSFLYSIAELGYNVLALLKRI